MKVALVSILFLLTACGYNNTHLNEAAVPSGGSNLGAGGTAVDFATVKAQVFEPYCIRCHSAAGGNTAGVNLEAYANVFTQLSRITGAVNSSFMPKNGVLPSGAKSLLNAWAQAGAPEQGRSATGTALVPVDNSVSVPNPIPCEDQNHESAANHLVPLTEDYFFNTQTQTITRQGSDCGDQNQGRN